MKRFAITGVAGYIAPRHLQAIKETGNSIIAAMDIHDSVGIMDRYFPDAAFFTEFERFDRHLEKQKRNGNAIDYISICSPNFLHDAHIRLGLRLGADAICEKPLVLKPWNLDALEELEQETGKKVYNILQLRVHPSLIALRDKIHSEKSNKKRNVVLTYITSRGTWYKHSWKGDLDKSGGVATNIGIHFFDMLMWFFGKPQQSELHLNLENKMAGFMELENANVRWYLSIDKNDLPEDSIATGKTTHRSITVENEEIEFTEGFTDLHTKIYQEILNGNGFGISDARPSIELVNELRNSQIIGNVDKFHPFVKVK
jgi:UDP-N-acetyl-2-amino-2-deoxyglucuronate dehydrogenase